MITKGNGFGLLSNSFNKLILTKEMHLHSGYWFTALFKNMQTLKFKSCLHTCTSCYCQSYKDHKQRTLKHRNTKNGLKSTNHKSQTMTF